MDDAMKAEELRRRAAALPEIGDPDHAGDRLERMSWTPELLAGVEGFHRISKDRLLAELEGVLALGDRDNGERLGIVGMDPARARMTQASLLVTAAELLWRLRAGDLDAWDHVNELYEDD